MAPVAAPQIVNARADDEFRQYAHSIGWNPDDLWVGRYVAYEWDKSRHYVTGLFGDVKNKHALEVGSNVGATSIVLASHGARVIGVEIDGRLVRLARLNAQRHGLSIKFRQITPGRPLPFADKSFDLVTCNSVLEYVASDALDGVLREIDRVLKPGGLLLVMGTSNRLAPKEVHSGRWLSNYLPRALDRVVGPRQRGIFPWQVRRRLGGYINLIAKDRGRSFYEIRRQVGDGAAKIAMVRLLAGLGAVFGLSAGEILPSFLLALKKPR